MRRLFAAALEIQAFGQSHGWPMCIIGGLGVIRWGRPRLTRDVDLSVFAGYGKEAEFVDPLLEAFRARIADARAFALARRVLLIAATNDVPIDIGLAGLPYEKDAIRRATLFEFAKDCQLLTASAEDMVILKAFADRPRDWSDIEGVLVRQGPHLDWDLIVQELTSLCELKESPEIVDRLLELRRKIDAED